MGSLRMLKDFGFRAKRYAMPECGVQCLPQVIGVLQRYRTGLLFVAMVWVEVKVVEDAER